MQTQYSSLDGRYNRFVCQWTSMLWSVFFRCGDMRWFASVLFDSRLPHNDYRGLSTTCRRDGDSAPRTRKFLPGRRGQRHRSSGASSSTHGDLQRPAWSRWGGHYASTLHTPDSGQREEGDKRSSQWRTHSQFHVGEHSQKLGGQIRKGQSSAFASEISKPKSCADVA